MQVLQSKEFVPNRTLQQLIQIWYESVQQRVQSNESTNSIDSVVSQDQVKDIIRLTDIKKKDFSENLSKIILFAKESDENKKFVAKFDGLVAMLVEILRNVNDVNILRQVIRVLDLILNKIEDQQQLMDLILKRDDQDFLNSMLLVLKQQENVDSRIESLRILEFIAVDVESKALIAEKDGLLSEILKSLNPDADWRLTEASLSCLIAISTPKCVKTKMITHKVIPQLRKLITDGNATVSVTEKVLNLIETLCSSKQGRMEISQDSALLHGVVQKMLKVSSSAT